MQSCLSCTKCWSMLKRTERKITAHYLVIYFSSPRNSTIKVKLYSYCEGRAAKSAASLVTFKKFMRSECSANDELKFPSSGLHLQSPEAELERCCVRDTVHDLYLHHRMRKRRYGGLGPKNTIEQPEKYLSPTKGCFVYRPHCQQPQRLGTARLSLPSHLNFKCFQIFLNLTTFGHSGAKDRSADWIQPAAPLPK